MSAPESLQETLQNLPTRPGVYLMHNAQGQVIYVGKAVNLRARVRSYFHASAQAASPRIAHLVREIARIEFIVTDSELEALILEANLIKRHRPRYNIRLKDDKRYPYIKVHWQDPFPKVTITRRLEQDGARYFGPFTSSAAVRETLETLRKLFPYLTCDRTITGRDERACLYYDIHLCDGPCIGAVGREAYRGIIAGLIKFLEGKTEEVVADLERRMQQAAADLRFEEAARYRDRLQAIAHVVEKQKIVSTLQTDQDVIAFAREEGDACVQVFFIRGGKLLGREYFVLEGTEEQADEEVLAAFLKQFYEEAAYVPPEVLLPEQIEEARIIEQWLQRKRGDRVRLEVPREGMGRDLVQMAVENAAETLAVLRARWRSDRLRQEEALRTLGEVLALSHPPARIEGYDIAHTQGRETTGSMVVFVQGVPRKGDYRRFTLRTVQSGDDYAALREVLTRRFRRYAEVRQRQARGLPLNRGEAAWALLPDLLLVDGGKGQLQVALEVLEAFDLVGQVPVVGLAKEAHTKSATDERLYLPGRSEPLALPPRSPALLLLQRVRDEAHRFALAHHRTRRRKAGLASRLEEIPGVGPVRRRRLLQHFGSLEALRAASVEEIAALPGIPRAVAEAIKEHLVG
ncbi:MAG TPA: excinuclease ABC subunit UvrC [Chloroflexi bacterium]|nr:excinuclease ABC subunit UvrC [Chloroflexota bacterium]